MIERLALGTVQFGMRYGIANRTGQIAHDEAAAILSYARNRGIDTLDTAITYGNSERCLGRIGVTEWRVVSKLPPLPPSTSDVDEWVCEEVAASLARLGIPHFHGLLLHRSLDLLGARGEALYRALRQLKQRGKVDKIGVSIYSPKELDALRGRYPLDLVQAPFNVMDRRLATSGWLGELHAAGTEIHARSAFLQGLLLMDRDKRPVNFQRWASLWERWHSWLRAHSLTPVEACTRFALSQPGIDRVIVGVDGLQQLRDIVAVAKDGDVLPPLDLMSEDEDLINPTRWTLH